VTQSTSRKICRYFFTGVWVLSIFASFFLLQGTSQAAETIRVKVKEANLRSGPGKKFEKMWNAPMNYPYRVMERKGKWLKVQDFSGYEDWIYGPLTDEKPAVVVKVKQANVRKGSSTNDEIVFTADMGVPFLVLDKKGDWLKVRHEDGDEGWIFQKLVWGSSKTSESKEPPTAESAKEGRPKEAKGKS
jgi:SH3-like domain-containing protein